MWTCFLAKSLILRLTLTYISHCALTGSRSDAHPHINSCIVIVTPSVFAQMKEVWLVFHLWFPVTTAGSRLISKSNNISLTYDVEFKGISNKQFDFKYELKHWSSQWSHDVLVNAGGANMFIPQIPPNIHTDVTKTYPWGIEADGATTWHQVMDQNLAFVILPVMSGVSPATRSNALYPQPASVLVEGLRGPPSPVLTLIRRRYLTRVLCEGRSGRNQARTWGRKRKSWRGLCGSILIILCFLHLKLK